MPTLAQLKAEVSVDGVEASTAKLGAFGAAVDKTGTTAATAKPKLMSHEEAMTKVGTGAMVAGGLMLAGFGLAVSAAADFDKAMSGVGAVSDASAGQLGKLRAAAIEAGKATVFSASEAAAAEAELAKAGVSTSDILGGALRGSLDLAAAGQIDLAESATIAAQAMNIFKLNGSDVGYVADVLAAGANKSAADVSQLGQAMQQGGLLAHQTGLDFEETIGALSAFADNALIGADAGTSLKSMLQRLTPQSKEAADMMDTLGISAYDSAGQFIGLDKFAGNLKHSMEGLTPEVRNSAMATIFGSDAVRAANILYDQGEKGIRKYTKAVNDQGAAGRMAATQLDNLSGDLEQLKGSLETALIVGGSGATGALRGMTQQATNAVNAFADLPEPVQAAATGLVGIGGAGLLVVGGLGVMVPKVREGVEAFRRLRTSAAELPGTFGKLGSKLGTAAVGITAFTATYVAMTGVMDGSKRRAAAGSAELLAGLNIQHLNDLEEGMARLRHRVEEAKKALEPSKGTGGSIAQVWQDINPFIDNEIQDEVEKLDEAKKHLAEFAGSRKTLIDNMGKVRFKLGETLDLKVPDAELTTRALAKVKDALGVDLMTAGAQGLMTLRDVKNSLNDTAPMEVSGAAIAQMADSLGVDLTAKGAKGKQAVRDVAEAMAAQTSAAYGAAGSIEAIGRAAGDGAEELDNFKAKMDSLLGVHLDATSAEIAYRDSLVALTQSVKDNGLTFDLNTDAGRRNSEAFIAASQAAEAHAIAIGKTSAGVDGANLVMQDEIARLGETAKAFGMTDQEALTYMEDLYGIPPDVRTDIHSTADLARLLVQGLHLDIDNVPKNTDLNFTANTAAAHNAIAALSGAAMIAVAAVRGLFNPGDHAAGGRIGAGNNLTWVGEQGKELVSLPTGSQVYSNAQSMRMIAGASQPQQASGGNTYQVQITVPIGADPAEAGRQFVRCVEAYERVSGARWRKPVPA